ncbi:DUF4148 domain-containing protein [Burkholderia sp. Ac-20344]|uniref:DUF4148 domain-containing protein n=1 Tax=Burkholderia sp. Ac-20344 TaxID=2703890 RepID=UPI00197C12C2|nr:DUF4148 domain-containing protein [Burkholderia sp. Ac-20344]MBN3832463.1 DUF4148 domain-containing protein [Burkholderia sp. Ac-20344]
MTTLLLATALPALCVALPGRASTTQHDAATAQRTFTTTAPAPLSSQQAWNAQPATLLTRAQVFRQQVRAERDGQLAQLNRERYSH